MPTSADVYVATTLFTTVLTCIAGAVVGLLLSTLLHLGLLFSIMLVFVLSIILGAVTYMMGMAYPGMMAGERGRKVDVALPYTMGFMYAMARSGASIVDIFRELSTRTDVGELQMESKVFMRDIEYLGRDPLTALRDIARTTPSKKFKTTLDVLISIIETGGEITPYFSAKCTELQNSLREEQKKAVSSLEFLSELYVILIAFAPLLFLGIFLFMSLLPEQTFNLPLAQVIVYAWIPIGSITFAVLIATGSTEKIKGRARITRLPSAYKDVTTTSGDTRDRMLLRRLRGTMWQVKLKRFMSNPFKIFLLNPEYILLISGPIGVFYLLSGKIYTYTFFWTFVIICLPYVIAYEFRSRRVGQIETALPSFLKSLSSASRSGLTLPRAMTVASTAELGALTDEVRRARRDIEWGSSSTEALARLEERIGVSSTAARATTLIRKASEAEENVSDVVEIVMADVSTHQTIVNERKASMFIYKIIVLLIFGVFLITSWFMTDSFLSPGLNLPAEQVANVKILFYHLILLEGMFTGFIAAQMGEGDLRGGVKYAIVLMLLSWLIFEFTIMPKTVKPPPPAIEEALSLGLMAF